MPRFSATGSGGPPACQNGRQWRSERDMGMNLRKIAVLGSFAAGAALALAPLAAADPAAVDPTLVTDVLSSEESSLNGIFVSEAALAGDSSDVTAPTATDPFDIITPADITTVQGTGTTAFD
jgi:hypothetical protein